ncbi:sulfatase-like protein [Cohnella sp. SGD-V74]|nr:sulfatase-like protein [Cohnella sp. SGD-V74]
MIIMDDMMIPRPKAIKTQKNQSPSGRLAGPAFSRLADKSVTFDNHWVGSMPCMPARRDLLTGRYNFLHRSWGPLEPFDDSLPALLRKQGVYSHLVSIR